MKVCSKCKIEKDESEFNKDKYSNDGLKYSCRICNKLIRENNLQFYKDINNNYYKNNTEKVLSRQKAYNNKNHDLVYNNKKTWALENKDKTINSSIKYGNTYVKFKSVINKLTIEEDPRLSEDGINVEVRCKHCKKYFLPIHKNINRRLSSIKGTTKDTNYLFCSEECSINYKINKRYLDLKNKLTNDECPILTNDNQIKLKCKQCGEYFIPKSTEIVRRIQSLNGKGRGESNLYCSKECKKSCSTFGQIKYPKDFKKYHRREVQAQLRKLRLEFDNHKCTKCGVEHSKETKLEVHHIEGIHYAPLESADLDMCMTVCEACHLLIHQQPGCKYSDFICREEDNDNLNGTFIPIAKTKLEEIMES